MEESLIKQAKAQRNYGIDLLRLISMFMVVVLHVLGQGGILSNAQSLSVKGEIFWFLEIFCYCAVNVFAIISGIVGLKAKHKSRNLINLCLQLMFYAIILTCIDVVVSVCADADVSILSIFSNLFPSVHAVWYFSAYFCLFFFIPMLNSIVENVPRDVLRKWVIFIFTVFSCFGTFSSRMANLNGGYSVLWLMILYLIGAYISKYDLLNRLTPSKGFLCFLGCVLLTSLSRIAFGKAGIDANMFVSYTSPTILLSAIFLVASFKKIKLGDKAKKIVIFLSPMTFGVYLFHCHPIVFDQLSDTFSWVAFESVYIAPFIVIGISLAIYASCLFIDWLRLLLFKACKMKDFSICLEKFFQKIFASISNLF